MTNKVAKLERASLRDPVKVQVASKWVPAFSQNLKFKIFLIVHPRRNNRYVKSNNADKTKRIISKIWPNSNFEFWMTVMTVNRYETVDRLIQHYLLIPAKFKDCYLAYLLTEHNGNSTMIFADTRKDVQRLTFILKNLGFSVLPLHGQMEQSERYSALSRFTSGGKSHRNFILFSPFSLNLMA